MKCLYCFFVLILSVFIGCNQEPSSEVSSNEGDTLNTSFKEIDTLNSKSFERDKWVSLSEESSESENALGYVPSKKRLEKRLEKEFATVDPLEFYLSENRKFSDKQAMIKKRKKIKKLNKIYYSNYYDLGHIPERRNNANMMLALTNTAYPLRSYSKMSDDFSDNKSRIEMKSGSEKKLNTSSKDLKTILNNAVQLINLSQLPEAEETINYLENNGLSKEYLLYYNKAFVRFKFSDFQEAIKYGKKSINFRKNFYLSFLLIGDSYLALGSNEKAYQYYTDALKIKENIVSLERVAYSALLLGKGDVSENCYSKILEKYKGNDRINYMAGYALSLAYNNKHELSFKKVKELKGLRKEWAVPFLIEGWNELLLGNYAKAEEAFSQSDKKGEKLYSSIGRAVGYYCRKDYSNSSRLFYYLEENPKYKKLERNPLLLIYAGYSFANTYNFTSAFLKFIDYAGIVKKDDCYFIGMSLCSYGSDDFHSAEGFLDCAGVQTDNLTEYYYLKGVYALRNLKYQNAKGSFEKSLIFNRENLRSMNGLGASLTGLKNYEKAISVFNDGLKLKPNDPYLLFNKASAVFNVAKTLYAKGSVKQAADTLKYGLGLMNKASAIDRSFLADINIGNAYSSIKDSSNALAYYSKVKNLAADVNIGSLYARFNMFDKAKNIWEQVRDTDTSFVLAGNNIKAIDMPYNKTSEKGSKGGGGAERFQYYESLYFEIGYHWTIPIPVLFESPFEPLVPLGYSNLKFAKISKVKKVKEEKED